jgi:hypothetical protein
MRKNRRMNAHSARAAEKEFLNFYHPMLMQKREFIGFLAAGVDL